MVGERADNKNYDNKTMKIAMKRIITITRTIRKTTITIARTKGKGADRPVGGREG